MPGIASIRRELGDAKIQKAQFTDKKEKKKITLDFSNLSENRKKCGEAVETAKHVIFDCPALCRRRSSYLEVVQKEGRQEIGHIYSIYPIYSANSSIFDAVQRRAIRLIGDPALTCRLQPLSHRRAVGDQSLFYRKPNFPKTAQASWGKLPPLPFPVQRRAIRLIGDPALTCHLQLLSYRCAVGDLSLFYLQRRAIRLIGDPALTCHLQPLSHRQADCDLSLFYPADEIFPYILEIIGVVVIKYLKKYIGKFTFTFTSNVE
nr:unnamed protein product [Callosobruchus chinensis]